MMHWERWMTETIQRGGRFVFLLDALPSDATGFANATFLSARDLLSRHDSTSPEDMVFIFESQFSVLQKVDSVLQGQRVLIGVPALPFIEMGWVDAAIPDLTAKAWEEVKQRAFGAAKKPLPDFRISLGQPCLFLDRDDVVLKNVPYNNDPFKVELTSGIVDLINRAHAKNWWVALVTNQSGLGRAKINWEDYQKVHQRMLKLLATQGAWIDECVWAGYIEGALHAAGDFYAGLRKPRPGMFQKVDEKLKIDRGRSVMIGDSATDVIAAYHAGIGTIYLLHTPHLDEEIQKLQRANNLLPGMAYKILSDFTLAF